jgi:hypothetical protein
MRQLRIILIATLFLLPISAVAATATKHHPQHQKQHPTVVQHQQAAPAQPKDKDAGGGKY